MPFSFATAASGIAFLIVFHELGHWLAARILGMKTLVFSIGFGGKQSSIHLGRFWDTDFRLGWAPLGGFVVIPESADEEAGRLVLAEYGLDPSTYKNQPVWKKLTVMAAGPAANLLLAYIIYVLLLWHYRGLTLPAAGITAVSTTGDALANVIQGIGMMLHLVGTDPALPPDAANLHGIVGIFQVVQNAAGDSLKTYAQVLAFLSINLSVLNMIPLPMLDGGQIAMLVFEKARGKPLSVQTRSTLILGTLMLLLIVTAFGLFNDFAHPIHG